MPKSPEKNQPSKILTCLIDSLITLCTICLAHLHDDVVRYIIGGLIVSTNLDGFSLANHGGFAKFMRLQKYAWHQDLVASDTLDLEKSMKLKAARLYGKPTSRITWKERHLLEINLEALNN